MLKFGVIIVLLLTSLHLLLPPIINGSFSLPETVIKKKTQNIGIMSSTCFVALGRLGIQHTWNAS